MGEARRRGTFEERKAKAIAEGRTKDKKPGFIDNMWSSIHGLFIRGVGGSGHTRAGTQMKRSRVGSKTDAPVNRRRNKQRHQKIAKKNARGRG